MTGIEQFLYDVAGARERLAASGVDLGRTAQDLIICSIDRVPIRLLAMA